MPPFESPPPEEDELDPLFCKVAPVEVDEDADDDVIESAGVELGGAVVPGPVVVITTTVVPPSVPEVGWPVVMTEVVTRVVGDDGVAVVDKVVTAVLGEALVDESEVVEMESDDVVESEVNDEGEVEVESPVAGTVDEVMVKVVL